ncbi:glycosyltransferase, partial [Cetobacterium sp.]|uniref:glycosyltransferase n=1 Tax=Cetobacterium sp. TaxID=2071632 RepID=UPI003F3A557F
KKYDHIIIETELVKFFPYFIEKIILKNTSYSLDYDDNPNLTYKKNKLFKLLYGNKINNLSREAKFVTVGNKWYYEEIESSNLYYLPTVIDLNVYSKNRNKDNKNIVIVWIGSPSTEKYLNLIEKPLQNLSKKFRIQLKLIGSKKKIQGVDTLNLEWKEEREVLEISNSDIGIMPLEDTDWEKGKCGFKLIQYMACGLPVVASSAPANLEIISGNGFIVKNIEEWEKKIEFLIKDSLTREEMGKKSIEIIKKRYTYQVWGKKYSEKIKASIDMKKN